MDMEKPEKLEFLLKEIKNFLEQPDSSEFTVLEWKGKEFGFRVVRRFPLLSSASVSRRQEKGPSQDLPLPLLSEFVGIFHFMGENPAPGMPLKSGQTLGYVESVNVKHVVETKEPGHLREILVKDGQRVEYGQTLFTYQGNHVP